LARRNRGLRNYRFRGVRPIPVAPLAQILRDHCPKSVRVDVLTVDVEGLDFQVLLSHDWENYRPGIVVIEDMSDVEAVQVSAKAQFLGERGYRLFAKTATSAMFHHLA